MKILITTFGTRGDLQPYIALGAGLNRAGFEAAICTPPGSRPFVEEYGLRYLPMDDQLLSITQDGVRASGPRDMLAVARRVVPAMDAMMKAEWAAAQAFEPGLILYHPKCMGSLHVAEKLGLPAVMALPLPFYTPTSAFPVPFMGWLRLGGAANRLSFRLMGLTSGMYTTTINDLRVNILGLPPVARFSDPLVRLDGSPVPVMYPYSPHLLPVPDDFPPHVHVTGYWFLDRPAGWQPDPALVRFLEAGPPPVYIGFGSMGFGDGEQRARLALEALRLSGQRGLLASGWGGLSAAAGLPPGVFPLESAPHDWLFPQVAAVVHHGGAGTTAAGLRAGVPSIICPFIADQPFWGRMVAERGAGPPPIAQMRLTAARLAEAIDAALHDPAMRAAAAGLGAQIRAEDGVARAVEILQSILAGRAAPAR
jgi:sterol 3beta-glucosyltransferase